MKKRARVLQLKKAVANCKAAEKGQVGLFAEEVAEMDATADAEDL